ncbi:hypothetical protein [Pantoea vagans]|uniref:hypothetical protein n=1 Tax=Pantoea vagans TaxID=470934 RepID=UPI0006835DA2|nr:hypothetical protein [Pantoea vagans]KNH33077.1 hypothetical protein ACS76_08855 [Pantoea vagans]
MKDIKYEYNLYEILCLRIYGEAFIAYQINDYEKKITEWAEREFISGNDSEALLILASLNLDKKPDFYEVEYYLLAYMRERKLNFPKLSESSVVWLKINTWYLLHVNSSHDIELMLHQIPAFPLGQVSRLASRITWQYYHLYEKLFDDWGPGHPSKASSMSDLEIRDFVRCRVKPYYRILCNPDWVWLLTH